MVNYQGASLEEQVKILLEQNLSYSKEIYHLTKKIRRQLVIGRTVSIIGLVIFVILPIVLGVAFLPSLLKNSFGNLLPASFGGGESGVLQELLGNTGINQEDIPKIIEDAGGLPNLLKKLNSAGQN